MDEDPVEIGVAIPPPGILLPSEFAADSTEESSSESRLDLEPYIEAVKLNPRSYDAHFALVHAAIELNLPTAVIRAAYENFSKAFPLSPELWKEWIEKEQSEVSLNIQYLRSLFESAFGDYQCAFLWIQYLKWLEEKCTDEVMDFARDFGLSQNFSLYINQNEGFNDHGIFSRRIFNSIIANVLCPAVGNKYHFTL